MAAADPLTPNPNLNPPRTCPVLGTTYLELELICALNPKQRPVRFVCFAEEGLLVAAWEESRSLWLGRL